MAVSRETLWASGRDESVEVNQRALIDKVLARYSGEFTVFRELLQNADDASSKEVEIHFETRVHLDQQDINGVKDQAAKPSLSPPDVRNVLIHQWSFKNDGLAFRDEDWSRLKKIAEGNPDEDKIGAFGVGFYALFSITEEPFVTSGDQWMGFYWKDGGDQLFVRRGALPTTEDRTPRKWTSFTLPLREQAALPSLFDLARFLTSSLTFMSHLSCVSVCLDGRVLIRVSKDTPGAPIPGPSATGGTLAVPFGKDVSLQGLRTTSPNGLMAIASVRKNSLFMEAEIARCVYALQIPPKPKPKPIFDLRSATKQAVPSGFFSSLFSSFVSPSPSPPPQVAVASSETPSVSGKEEDSGRDALELLKSSIVLTIFTAYAAVRVNAKLRDDLLRATKKNPPSNVAVALIYTGKAEFDASKREDDAEGSKVGTVFQGLRADLDGLGTTRVFIQIYFKGHATGQTTGIGGHVAARFIPTVERESIDLVDQNVSIWNKELLYVTGFLTRAAYNEELTSVRDLWDAAVESGSEIDEQVRNWLTDRALHALQFFTFRPSTPSSVVSSFIEASFFSCAFASKHPFHMMSTLGPKNALDIRLPNSSFSSFLKDLPVVPPEIMEKASMMIETLKARDVLHEITFADVLKELAARPLGKDEFVGCLKWWISVWNTAVGSGELVAIRNRLLDAALLNIKENDAEKVIPLNAIRTFVNLRTMGSTLPLDSPMPPHTLPLSVTRPFQTEELRSAFGWSELTVVDWLRYVVETSTASNSGGGSQADAEFDITVSSHFAERVLFSLSKAWTSLPKPVHVEIVQLLGQIPCIPTRTGIKKPGEAYFPNAHIFSDLPVVLLPNSAGKNGGATATPIRGSMEKLLEAIGVRKHVDLQVVFDRMVKTGDWTISELIKYLVAVQQTLTQTEMDRLAATAAFPCEHLSQDLMIHGGEATVGTLRKYRANELYEPLEIFRNLGLPVIDWGTHIKWRSTSDEAKFMFSLGLRRHPSMLDLLNLASGSDVQKREAALKYFLDNHSRYPEYHLDAAQDKAYIPAVTPAGSEIMAKPNEVYVDSDSAIFGFNVIQDTFRDVAVDKLKLKRQPPPHLIVSLLEKNPPGTVECALKWFDSLAGRVIDFTPAQLTTLSGLAFVPAVVESYTDKLGNKSNVLSLRMVTPKQCYFKRNTDNGFHSKLFTFVDFGSKANGFLSACGTKHEPSVEEIVQVLLEDPKRFYRLCEGKDSYLTELRNIAINRRLLSAGTMTRMRKAPILFGSRRVRATKVSDKKRNPSISEKDHELDDDEWDIQYDLLKPNSVVVADDTNAYQIFGDAIFTAPQEDLLEGFYMDLGSPKLTALIREEYRTSAEIKDARVSRDVRSLVLERLPLFLHEHTHNRTKVQFSWLNNEKNFVVRTFGKLTVLKFLNFSSTHLSRDQDASATARRNGTGPVELWLAGNAQIDLYECEKENMVAISLCRLLFDSPKPNDSLLFMTILSTDLRALRRRGYNVDRILKQQRAEREAAEQARRERDKEMEKLLSDAQPDLPNSDHVAPIIPKSTSEAVKPPLPSLPGPNMPTMELEKKPTSRPNSSFIDSFQGLKKKFGSTKNDDVGRTETGPSKLQSIPSRPSSPAGHIQDPPSSPSLPGAFNVRSGSKQAQQQHQTQRTPHVTPMSNIESNIRQAIAACRGENQDLLHNREEMHVVKESLEEGYCDIAGRVGNLVFIGSMSDVRVYVTNDITNPRRILEEKRDSIARFIHIIHPLRTLYSLPATSVHIFFDLQGDSIAFNRNASIFLNLRFFEAWHDAIVERGDFSKAFISWFFTLAHEIAHNLVQAHNSEHEFYFSSICEAYVVPLSRLLEK